MKARSLLLAAAAVAILMPACTKEDAKISRAPGEEIVFGAQTSGDADTKAAYSGTTSTSNNHTYERINWTVGDCVRIVCPQASEPTDKYLTGKTADKYEDYTISTVTAGTGDDIAKSTAGITHPNGSIGLRWGTASTHCFYSLYPCPSSLSGVGLSDNGTNIIATCVLPGVQTYGTLAKSDGNYTASPNPAYMYLVGYSTATSSGSGEVQINYGPAFTAFEITVQNDFESQKAMTVASAGLVTTNYTTSTVYLTGKDDKYDVRINDGTLETVDITTGSGGQSIMMNFSEGDNKYISIAYGKTLTFTVFAQPGTDITGLTFKMTDKDGKIRTSDLKYRKATDTDWVTFKAFHKSRITGLMAPETSRWYIDLGGDTEGDITLDDYESGYSVNVTQITLKQTTLDLYYKGSAYYASEADANAGTNALTTKSIEINGEYDSGGYLSSTVDAAISSYIGSAVSLKSGKLYKVDLTLKGTPSADVTGNVNVGDSNTNSTAHLAVNIHYLAN